MVRLPKVKKLEARKRFLLAKSEMYRQTLTLEIANLKFSTALLKRKLKSKGSIFALLALAVPMAGLLVARKRPKPALGLLPKLISGWKLFGRIAPLWQRFSSVRRRANERVNIT